MRECGRVRTVERGRTGKRSERKRKSNRLRARARARARVCVCVCVYVCMCAVGGDEETWRHAESSAKVG